MPVRKKLHLSDFSYTGSDTGYFMTLCTHGRENYFQNNELASEILRQLIFRIRNKEVIIYCYCIMPDHLHLLASLTDEYKRSLQDWIIAFKRYSSNIAKGKFGIDKLWQTNFYEHIIRGSESMANIGEYILNNPVRKGLVNEWYEYKFCGYLIDETL